MKDPQVLGEPGRHERHNRLGEAAQSPNYPVGGVRIDSSLVHGQHYDARGRSRFAWKLLHKPLTVRCVDL
jgi:hypothetical protein